MIDDLVTALTPVVLMELDGVRQDRLPSFSWFAAGGVMICIIQMFTVKFYYSLIGISMRQLEDFSGAAWVVALYVIVTLIGIVLWPLAFVLALVFFLCFPDQAGAINFLIKRGVLKP